MRLCGKGIGTILHRRDKKTAAGYKENRRLLSGYRMMFVRYDPLLIDFAQTHR